MLKSLRRPECKWVKFLVTYQFLKHFIPYILQALCTQLYSSSHQKMAASFFLPLESGLALLLVRLRELVRSETELVNQPHVKGVCTLLSWSPTRTLGISSSQTVGRWEHMYTWGHTAVAKSHQSCPTLFDPIEGSPPGSHSWDSPGKNMEWVAISFSSAWKWKMKVKLLSRVRLFVTPWTAAYQAPPSLGFPRQDWTRLKPASTQTLNGAQGPPKVSSAAY